MAAPGHHLTLQFEIRPIDTIDTIIDTCNKQLICLIYAKEMCWHLVLDK